jgi:hypothetical protein
VADFKEVWQYAGTQSSWSEVFYCQGGSIQDVARFTGEFLNDRLRLLNQTCHLRKIRVSEVGNPRVSTVVSINKPGLSAGVPLEDGVCAVVNLASTVVPSSRKWYLRGLTQGDISRDLDSGADTIAPGFKQNLDTWILDLANPANKYEVLPQSRVGQNGVVLVRVLSVNGVAGNGKSIITTDQAHGLVAGNTCIFSLIDQKVLPGLKGKFTVESVDGLTFTVAYKTPGNANITAVVGKVKKYAVVTGAFINANVSGWSHSHVRKTRNFSINSRGAARSTKIRMR